MNDQSIEDRIKTVLTREAMVRMGSEDIDNEMSLIDDLGLDSIQVLEFIIGLEEEFGISFEEEDLSLELFENVNSVVEYVRCRLKKTNRPANGHNALTTG